MRRIPCWALRRPFPSPNPVLGAQEAFSLAESRAGRSGDVGAATGAQLPTGWQPLQVKVAPMPSIVCIVGVTVSSMKRVSSGCSLAICW